MKQIDHTSSIPRIALALAAALLISCAIAAYITLVETQSIASALNPSLPLQPRFGFLAIFLAIGSVALSLKGRQALRLLFRWRWVLAWCLYALCVIFDLSGSSVGLLMEATGVDGSTLYGTSRGIRSDEWAVFTPMAFSQCTTDGGVFSYFQDAMRGVETDMFCIYGQPVWDIAELFRPFQWGYLLLGPSRGLSFFWCGRFIFLFLISFEFAFRIITRNSKWIACAYAFLITFSGVVQWWFSVNGLVEMLLFGQLALIWAQAYLRTEHYPHRLLYSLGIAWCLGIFVLAFYPAWQIPFGYVFLAFLVALLTKEAPSAAKGKTDVLLCLLILTILAAVAAYVFLFRSWDTVQTVLGTAYPGKRESFGGGAGAMLLLYPLSVIAPISQHGFTPNVCEAASFYTAFPLCLILPLIVAARQRDSRVLLFALLAVILFIGIYSVCGFPGILAKMTLMDKTTPERAIIAAQFAMIGILCFSLDRIRGQKPRKTLSLAAGCLIVVAPGCICAAPEISPAAMAAALAACALLFEAIAHFLITQRASVLCGTLICICLLSGALVNPLRGSVDAYFASDTARAIAAANNKTDKWIVMGRPVAHNNIPASLGARTLNSTNTYPQLNSWFLCDPTHESEYVYNRYAHITIRLDAVGAPSFELTSPDAFTANLSINDLSRLGVTRILADTQNCPDLNRYDGVSVLGEAGPFTIYSLEPQPN